MSGPRPASTEEVDSVVIVEAVESMQAGGGTVRDHAAARPERGDSAALTKALWGRCDAHDARTNAVEHADIEEPSLSMPRDAEASEVVTGGDAVVVVELSLIHI